MFYFDLRHNLKYDSQRKLDDERSKYRSSKTAYHYITRTLYFSQHKSEFEELEYSASYNMPEWAESDSSKFWQAADQYEIKRGRTSSHITIALPKELDRDRRIELSERLMYEFCGQYKMPCTVAIHNHVASLDGNSEQPHLHLLFSERSMMDNIERSPEQFFKQYRPKNPEKGGALKITADVLGFGRNILFHYRGKTEKIMNEFLEKYAPTKSVEIYGIKLEVKNEVSCLSNEDYNKKYGTNLKDVPQVPREILYNVNDENIKKLKEYKYIINEIRGNNLYEIYKKEYELELFKKREWQHENSHCWEKSKNDDFGF